MTVCGIKCTDLTTQNINILVVHFSYSQKLQIQKKLCEKHHQYAKYFKFMENEKYFSEGENNNPQNISTI